MTRSHGRIARWRSPWLALATAIGLVACSPADPAPEASPEPPAPQRLVDGGTTATIVADTRAALILKPDEAPRARFDVVVPPEPTLEVSFGIPNGSILREAGATRFAIVVEAAGERTPLLDRRVDPTDLAQRRWYNARLDLSRWTDQAVTVEFGVTPGPEDDRSTLAAFANPTLRSGAHRDERPNLLVVSLDTLRAQSTSTYGYTRETTPFLTELAAKGVLFEDAITTSTTTAPSHMSLFTGLYPVKHGVRTGYNPKQPSAILTETLREVGYQTAAFTENGFIVRARGFGDGFDEYQENRGTRHRGPGEVHKTFPQAQRWLTRRARSPFFLFVHTYQPHSPYFPPKEYKELFSDEPVPNVKNPVMNRLRDDYDREIRYTDDRLRVLVDVLARNGQLENTLIVVLSDHGEEFHEHGVFQHGTAVFEESLRIPLVMTGPGIPAGRRVPEPVSLIDVFPTLVELLGLPPLQTVDGIGLAPAIRAGTPLPDRVLYAEAASDRRWIMPFNGITWNPPLIAARTKDEKLIVHRPWEGEAEPAVRYDLAADPLERNPLPVEGETAKRAEALIAAYLSDGDTRPVVPDPSTLDPDERRRLELLGYIAPEE